MMMVMIRTSMTCEDVGADTRWSYQGFFANEECGWFEYIDDNFNRTIQLNGNVGGCRGSDALSFMNVAGSRCGWMQHDVEL